MEMFEMLQPNYILTTVLLRLAQPEIMDSFVFGAICSYWAFAQLYREQDIIA
jgi:hypothetical protein